MGTLLIQILWLQWAVDSIYRESAVFTSWFSSNRFSDSRDSVLGKGTMCSRTLALTPNFHYIQCFENLLKTSPSPPLDNIRVVVIVWRLRGELLCAGLCDTTFTVCSTLMWAVLTGQTDWACHIGTLMLCIEAVAYSCIIVTWWSGSGGIQAWSLTTNCFPSVLWHCWFGHLACKNHPGNDL